MAKVAAYARYSSEMQDGHSIDTQLSKIREAAAKNVDEIVAIYKDEGETGRDADRKDFMRMFNDIKSGSLKTSVIYVYKFSRFMRSSEESFYFKMQLEGLGVDVVSVMEPMPENEPLAKLMERIIEATDAFQSGVIGSHVLSAMEVLTAKGYWPGGPAPFGYRILEIENREGHLCDGKPVLRGTLAPDEKESGIVKRLFELSATTGWGGHRIYGQVSEEIGGPIVGRNGKPIGGRGVNEILRNSIYKGLFIYNKYGTRLVYNDDPHSPRRMRKVRIAKDEKCWTKKQNEDWRLVCDELWQQAQANRQRNSREDFGHGAKRANYLLTGMIACGACGNSVGGHWQVSRNGGNRYHYYRCRGAMNGGGLCDNGSKVRGSDLEHAIIAAIETTLFTEQFMDELVADVVKLGAANAAEMPDRPAMEKRAGVLSDEIRRLTEVAAKLPDTSEIIEQISIREKERRRIQKQLTDLVKPVVDPAKLRAAAMNRIGSTLSLLQTPGDMAAMRQVLRNWIESIRLDGDGQVWIKWRASSVIELLGTDCASEIGAAGTLNPHFGRSLRSLYEWHSIPVTTTAKRPHLCTVGFSGFSGHAATVNDNCVIGFSRVLDFAPPQRASVSGMIGSPACSGFSVFSPDMEAIPGYSGYQIEGA